MKKAVLLIGLLVLVIALSGCITTEEAVVVEGNAQKVKDIIESQCITSTTEDECNRSHIQSEEAFFICAWNEGQCIPHGCINITIKEICNMTPTRFGYCKWYESLNACGVSEKTATQKWR